MFKLNKENVQDILPLSPVQEGILFHHINKPNSDEYHQQVTLCIKGDLIKEYLIQAFKKVVDDNDGMRCIFRWENLKNPVQILLNKPNYNIVFANTLNIGNRFDLINIEERPFSFTVVSTNNDTHTLIFNYHHILLDGWSFGVFITELLSNYQNLIDGNPREELVRKCSLRHYIDYILKRDNSAKKVFWSDLLKTYDPDGTCFSYTSGNEEVICQVSKAISVDLKEKIMSCSRKHRVSLASIYYTVWALLLYRYTGIANVTFGTSTSGRPEGFPNVNELVGMFINTLPFHVQISGDQKISLLISEVNNINIEIVENEFISIREIKECADLKISGELFDTLCVVDNYPLSQVDTLKGARVEFADMHESTNYGICLSVLPSQLDNDLLFSYKPEKYSKEFINKIYSHFIRMLELVSDHNDYFVKDIDLLSVGERRQILEKYNNTDYSFDDVITLHKELYKKAQIHPEKVALIFEDIEFSYEELDKSSSNLAAQLLEKGVEKGIPVAVCMERSLELLISIFAIFKVGSVYLPIAPEFPGERVRYILNDSSVCHVLVKKGGEYSEEINEEHQVIRVNHNDLLLSPLSDLPVTAVQHDTNVPAYIVYTSGSTGKPKGVLVSHRSLINRIHWMQKEYLLSPSDVLIQKTPIVFDVSIWELFWWVVPGASLTIAPPGAQNDIDTLTACIEKNQVTVIHFVPPMLRMFTSYIKDFGLANRLTSLKRTFVSGEELKPSDVYAFYDVFGPYQNALTNLYGPTEATIDVTYYNCEEGIKYDYIPIGRPIANTQIYILNSDFNLQPVGLAGELCIGGVNVALGYINQEDLTKERFLDNPFGEGKMYRTGDLAKWDQNGNVIFLGRKDFQVKIKGFRIELSEIENCLTENHNLNDASVLVIQDKFGENKLVAFCVESQPISAEEIQAYLKSFLPDYMVPADFHFLDKLPLTYNGKVDRKKLESLHKEVREIKNVKTFTAVQENKTLSQVLEICKEVLPVENLRPSDNFFRAGGDSIKAIRLLSSLRKAGYHIRLQDILDTPTLSDLALKIKATKGAKSAKQFKGTVPLNPIQANFFAVDQKNIDYYNQAIILKLKVAISTDGLADIIASLTQNHDVFRLKFSLTEKEYLAIYLEEKDLYPVKEYTLSDDPDEKQNWQSLLNLLHSELSIKEGNMTSFAKISTNYGDYLIIVMHHLIVDGVSWRIILEDINTLMGQYQSGTSITLPKTHNSFGQYVSDFVEKVNRGGYNEEVYYWQDITENIGESILEIKNTMIYKDLSRNTRTLDKVYSNAVKTVNEKLGTNVNEVLLAALGLAIKRCLKTKEFLVNLEGHGRRELNGNTDLTRTIGWFTTLFPVRLNLCNSDNIINYVRRVRETVNSVPGNGEGYGALKYLTDKKVESSKAEICFNFLGDFKAYSETEFFSASIDNYGKWVSDERTVQHPIEVFVIPDDYQYLNLTINFVKEAISEDEVSALMDEISKALLNFEIACKGAINKIKSPSDFSYSNILIESLDAFLEQHREVKDIYELSPTQEGILQFCTANDDHTEYIVNSGLYLQGSILVDVFGRAYNILIKRHDLLRTIFTESLADRPLQVIQENTETKLIYKDFSSVKSVKAEELMHKCVSEGREAVRYVFSLTPNIFLCLIKLPGENYKLIFCYHHILLDGWSVVSLWNELFSIYKLLYEDKDPYKYMDLIPSYSTYIKWLREKNTDRASDYWSKYLHTYKEPFTFRKKERQEEFKEDSHVKFHVDEETYEKVLRFVANNGGTVYNYLQTVWAMLLSKVSGNTDIVFGQVVSGRPEIAKADLMLGLFINTVPKRVIIGDGVTFKQLVNSVIKDEIATIPHHYYHLSDILTKSLLRDKLFSHTIVFENQYQLIDIKSNMGEKLDILGFEGNDPNHYDVSLFFSEVGNTLTVEIRYDKNSYDHQYFQDIRNNFENLLSETAETPNKPVEDILINISGELDLPMLIS